MRSKIIIGNWKMNKTVAEAEAFVSQMQPFLNQIVKKGIKVGVAPSFLALSAVKKSAGSLLTVAQNCHFADSGAFTGEVSVGMLKELGIQYCLVGHSERRQYFNESNETCQAKLKQLVAHGLTPVYCVGETLQEFESNQTQKVVQQQLRVGLQGLNAEAVKQFIIAYEPVWSIGTGKNADATIAETVCRFIRQEIQSIFGRDVAEAVHIQYGGSVKPANITDYLNQPNIDGALVGGASLKVDSFQEMLTNIG